MHTNLKVKLMGNCHWLKLLQQIEDYNHSLDKDLELQIQDPDLTHEALESLKEDTEDEKASVQDLEECIENVIGDLCESVHNKVDEYLDHWRGYGYSIDNLYNYRNLNEAIDSDDFSALSVFIVWEKIQQANLLND